jgi:hypothetical protein
VVSEWTSRIVKRSDGLKGKSGSSTKALMIIYEPPAAEQADKLLAEVFPDGR